MKGTEASKKLASHLRELAAEYGIGKLAAEMGVDRNYFGNAAREGEIPSHAKLMQALDLMGVDPRDFFRDALGDSPSPRKPRPRELPTDP